MPATLMPLLRFRAVDANGKPYPGAKLYFFEAGAATTPQDTYSDVDLAPGHVNANPVVADAGGLFGPIFFLPKSYYVRLATSAAVIVWDQDNVSALLAASASIDISGSSGPIGGLTVGDCVYLSDGQGGQTAGKWYQADADFNYASREPVLGFVISASALTDNVIRIAGEVTLAGLTVGARYYLSTVAGAITTAPHAARRRLVGQAKSATVLVINTNLLDPDYVAIAYGSGNFTATGGGSWTVAVGDAGNLKYFVDNSRKCHVIITLDTTSVAGTVTALNIALPAGLVATGKAGGILTLYDNSATVAVLALWQIAAGASSILIQLASGANFTASADLTYLRLSAAFEVD